MEEKTTFITKDGQIEALGCFLLPDGKVLPFGKCIHGKMDMHERSMLKNHGEAMRCLIQEEPLLEPIYQLFLQYKVDLNSRENITGEELYLLSEQGILTYILCGKEGLNYDSMVSDAKHRTDLQDQQLCKWIKIGILDHVLDSYGYFENEYRPLENFKEYFINSMEDRLIKRREVCRRK